MGEERGGKRRKEEEREGKRRKEEERGGKRRRRGEGTMLTCIPHRLHSIGAVFLRSTNQIDLMTQPQPKPKQWASTRLCMPYPWQQWPPRRWIRFPAKRWARFENLKHELCWREPEPHFGHRHHRIMSIQPPDLFRSSRISADWLGAALRAHPSSRRPMHKRWRR